MNVISRFSVMAPYIRGKALHELFPSNYMVNLPYAQFPVHCCIRCGKAMSQHEMFPHGKTPRAICPGCWNELTSSISVKCWVCHECLESSKIDMQMHNPRDLHHRMHGGKCADYFSLESARMLGYETGIREEHSIPNVPQIEFQPVMQMLRNFSQPLPQKALPMSLGLKFNDLFSGNQRTHNGKKVRVLR